MDVFEGKRAIVTGSGRGIGKATAERLAAGGARVLVCDLDREAAEETARALPGDAAVFVANLADGDAPERLVQAAIDEFGGIDIIVNNAGYTLDAPIHRMSDELFDDMLELHLKVPFRILRAAAPHLREPAKREREEGREVFRKVVNVTSVAGTMGNAGQANYSSAKAAVVGLTKTLAKEWGGLKINVNAVAFGLVDTRLTVVKQEDSSIDIDGQTVEVGIPEAARSALQTTIPLGRLATAAEAAGGITFLCSPWSDFVTGQVLTVSGGIQMGMTS